jgi:hypothetical protein
MGGLIWGGVVLACLIAAWLIFRGPLRQFTEGISAERARELFRKHREWLEADFLSAMGKTSPTERVRWENAQWHDEIFWARDRQTRRLLALIGVHFSSTATLFDDMPDSDAIYATALFEFRNGRWHAEGKRLEEIRPDEVVRRHRRFEPVIVHPRRGY